MLSWRDEVGMEHHHGVNTHFRQPLTNHLFQLEVARQTRPCMRPQALMALPAAENHVMRRSKTLLDVIFGANAMKTHLAR